MERDMVRDLQKEKTLGETDTGRQRLMTTDNTNTTRKIHWLPGPVPGCSRCWSGHPAAGYHQNGGTGADGSGPCKPILHLDQSWMFLVGRGAFPLLPWCGG